MATPAFKIGEPVTITVDPVGFIGPSEAKVREVVNKLYPFFLKIVRMSRPFASGNHIITFTPRQSKTAAQWSAQFESTFKNAGYQIQIADISGGYESQAPGGLLAATTGAISDVGSVPIIGQTMSTIKWVAIGVVALVAFVYLPKPRRAK